MTDEEHQIGAHRFVLEWLLLRTVGGSNDPRAALADFRTHMEESAKSADKAAHMLLKQNKVDGYINAMAAAVKVRELATELAASIAIA
jgi:hypothetical protein